MEWQWPVGAIFACALAIVTTPAGVSGAVLLLPFQVSVLNVPSPAVTPTNLLYNVAATPGGLLRFWRERRLKSPLTAVLLAGTIPGVIAGAILRVELFAGARAFTAIAAGVLLPLGLWLLLASRPNPPAHPRRTRRRTGAVWVLALVVGTVGGIYGVGGGSLLAPILLATGYTAYETAPATLTSTFVTSIAGVATYQALQIHHGRSIAPEWILGLCLGAGGFVGSYIGARLQHRLPETTIRRLLGLIACLVAIRYITTAAQNERATPSTPTTAIAAG